jgi:hypothetical protein
MREIKFKGIRKDNHNWVYGFYANIQEKEHYILTPSAIGLLWVEVSPETVGQFTGLTDAHRKEIYYGDIVTDGFKDMVVKWQEQSASFYLSRQVGKQSFYRPFNECAQSKVEGNPIQLDNTTIIGNIYQ